MLLAEEEEEGVGLLVALFSPLLLVEVVATAALITACACREFVLDELEARR